MANKIDISGVFSGFGVPEKTYVAQEEGMYERLLTQGVKELGTLCLVTGSSKTGKTTLYNKILEKVDKSPLLIRCDDTIDADEFWKRPLESVDFSRLKEINASKSVESKATTKIGGKIGWEWLAGLIGEVSLGIQGQRSDTIIREAILAKPSPYHLIPLLKSSNAVLVVEDFHYLDNKVQKQIFQQWKVFVDNGVSVIVVGTTHHGVDLAYANSDLIGRIQHIDLMRWSNIDLNKIAKKGFNELGIELPIVALKVIARESAGLPIITQQACGQLFFDKELSIIKKGEKLNFNKQDSFDALHHLAINRYKQFDSWYTRLTTGPRKGARKYNTYELLLLTFTLDPLKFDLKRHEIDERLSRIRLKDKKKPPTASINSTLSALGNFQRTNGFELLEWVKRDQVIYVLEPAFLFYIRWREPQTEVPDILETIRKLLKVFDIDSQV